MPKLLAVLAATTLIAASAIAGAGIIGAGVTGAAAQGTTATGEPDTEGGRFVLRRIDDGLMRMDRTTGATSFCRKRESGWACEAVADDREALEGEIARLSRENSELAISIGRLRDQIAALEARTPRDLPGAEPQRNQDPQRDGDGGDGNGTGSSPAPGDGAPGDSERTLRLPSDQEIDQVVRTFESMMRRFLESMKTLREDFEEDRT